jgi:hypothetical protein
MHDQVRGGVPINAEAEDSGKTLNDFDTCTCMSFSASATAVPSSSFATTSSAALDSMFNVDSFPGVKCTHRAHDLCSFEWQGLSMVGYL